MHSKERTAVSSLAAIMAFRMLGLFMILPIFSLYTKTMPHATATMIGLALGIYGLTQACLQMPFGMLSDRIGRKPVITLGLLLFALGSVVAALSHSIYGIILGRALQGAGAIGSTTLAMVADLTRDENRSKAMATIGLTIGFSFSIAMIVGPIINAYFHLAGIFWLTALLALLGIVLLYTIVPTPPTLLSQPEAKPQRTRIKAIITNPQLLRLDLGIFVLHCMLTAMFIAIPVMLNHTLRLSEHQQVLLYLVVLVIAFITMVPLIIIAEKKRQMKPIFTGAIAMLVITQCLLLIIHHSAMSIGITLLLFFAAFTLLEASLPSLISKISPIRNKGTAMGVYSTSQFLGIFVGGSLGGWIFGHFHMSGLFIFCATMGLIWFLTALTMRQPPYLSTLIFKADETNTTHADQLSHRLYSIPGVADVAIMASERLIYLKVDKKLICEDELRKLIRQSNLL